MTKRLLVAGVVVALIGAACGDDTADTTSSSSTTTTMAPATTLATTTVPTTTTTTAPPTTVTTTTTTAPTTTTTTLPPPPDPTDWIGVEFRLIDTGGLIPEARAGLDASVRRQVEYSVLNPPGLQTLQTQCVGIDYICDYSLTVTLEEGEFPPSQSFAGPLDFIALLEIRGEGATTGRIVDAVTIRGIGSDLVWSTCWTSAGDVEVIGVWDRITGVIAAFRWDVTAEDLWVIQGSEVGQCWDPMDNE